MNLFPLQKPSSKIEDHRASVAEMVAATREGTPVINQHDKELVDGNIRYNIF